MTADWVSTSLGQFCSITMGQSPAGAAVNRNAVGIPLLNGPTEFGARHPAPVQWTSQWTKEAEPGDLLFCVRGSTTGRMNWADQTYAIGRGIASLRGKSQSDTRFARAVIDVRLAGLLQQATGSTFPNLSRRQLSEVDFICPPTNERERIAGVLGSFDDLIETNREVLRHINRLGNAVVLPLACGVTTVPMAEACDVIESGRRPKGGVKGITSGVPSIGAEFINGLTEFEFAKTKFVPVEFATQMRRGVVADLDVLVYKDGGKPGEFFPDVSVVGGGYPFEHMVINEHVFRVRGSKGFGQGYLYFWLSTEKMMGLMKEAGSRTAAIPGMNSTNFGQLPVAVPDQDWRSAHMSALDELLVSALSLLAENRDLARQRDELLPLLMSGRVRVRDVEAAVS